MLGLPKTRYTTVGRDHIAYQVLGEGPPDLVFVPHWNTNVEALWDFPPLARFVRQLASFGRVVLFDKRGTGLSDALSAQGEPLLEQFAASPNAAYDTRRRILGLDVRDVLPTVQAPTLVIHRTENEFFGADHGRYFARHIEGARLVEMPGDDHLMYIGDTDTLLGEIEVFVTGERRQDVTDRVLVTVLFIDIVKSTSRLAEVGDRRWRELLDRYDAEVARNLVLFRGRQVKNTGDGTLAVFDGPARAFDARCRSKMHSTSTAWSCARDSIPARSRCAERMSPESRFTPRNACRPWLGPTKFSFPARL
jgi:hypothetical protein